MKLFLLFGIALVADIYSKTKIFSNKENFICNKGIAFGLDVPDWLPAMFFVFVCLLILFEKEKVFPNKKVRKIITFPLSLLFAGAVGNLWSRYYFGCVVDFLSLPFISFFPLFNLADVYLTLSLI